MQRGAGEGVQLVVAEDVEHVAGEDVQHVAGEGAQLVVAQRDGQPIGQLHLARPHFGQRDYCGVWILLASFMLRFSSCEMYCSFSVFVGQHLPGLKGGILLHLISLREPPAMWLVMLTSVFVVCVCVCFFFCL